MPSLVGSVGPLWRDAHTELSDELGAIETPTPRCDLKIEDAIRSGVDCLERSRPPI